MTEKQRTPYQQEMDQVHVPKEKADETLQMMLRENQRLRREEAAKEGKPKSRYRIPVIAVSLAAACALLVIVFSTGNPGLQFDDINLTYQPLSNIRQDDSPRTSDTPDFFGTEPEAVFPGWEIVSEQTEQFQREGNTIHESRLTLEKGEQEITAVVTDFEPSAFSAIRKEQKIEGKDVRLARDPAAGTCIAAYRKEQMYIVLEAKMSENDFIDALKSLLGTKN